MRQVPSYTVIGDGRMAIHLCQYFDYMAIPYHRWYRSKHTTSQLDPILAKSSHVIVLISDGAIEQFIKQHILPKHQHLTIIHFSGCLSSALAHAAHPLQTFSQATLYAHEEYQKIPFVLEQQGPRFEELLPGFDNPYYYINKEDKGYYHAMCVLANNVSTLLWQKFYREMQQRFGIQSDDLRPYLSRTFQNIQANPELALTGPLARGDVETLLTNISALTNDPFADYLKVAMEHLIKEV